MSQGKACHAGHGSRREALESVATAAGLAWAASWADRMRTEGRPVRGGWPGTLSEARGHLITSVAVQLGTTVVLTYGEMLCLGRATYETARRAWLSNATRDSETSNAMNRASPGVGSAQRLCDQPVPVAARVRR
jgi:hypothetical protein